MNNPNTPKLSPLSHSNEVLSLNRISRFRSLLFAAISATTISSLACSGDDEVPNPPARGSSCVTVRDQNDEIMKGCDFGYKISKSLLDEDQDYYERYGFGKTPENPCSEEKLWVYSTPGQHKIDVKCEQNTGNKLAGYIKVDIDQSSISEHSSRLINSFCNDEYKFIADPMHPIVKFNDHLAFSNDTWCANKQRDDELVKIEVVDIERDCTGQEENCKTEEGRDLLRAHGIPMQFEEGEPSHLTFTARIDLIPEGEERILSVLLKHTNSPIQELRVPVTIRSNVSGNDI